MSKPRHSLRYRTRPKAHFLVRLLLAAIKLAVIAGLSMLALGVWLFYAYGSDLPDPQQMGRYHPFETTRIYARDGQTLLFELTDAAVGKRTVVSLDRIPDSLKNATISVEDAGFYENPGVDLRGIIRALWLNYSQDCNATDCPPVSGGSTITQQLVRNVLFTEEERTDISYKRKLREAILAYRVNNEYSKDQILSLYLNEVYYGNQAYGVEAAAQSYFGKSVWDLSMAEATLIAGLPQSPTVLNPFVNMPGAKARQQVTLNLMVKSGYITRQEAAQIFDTPVQLVQQNSNIIAPHFVYYVRDLLEQRYGPEVLYNGGLRVTTSLDVHWQQEAQRIASERMGELMQRNASNASVVMMAPDGQVLAMLGSVNFADPSIDGQVNVALSPRQPGSALKPIVYAAAMQRGWTPATVIWDVPSKFNIGDGTFYEPMNYDNSWHGPQRLRMALANSLNIPAVKALEYVGVNNFVQVASQMGITTFTNPANYGLAMALGSNEVRLLDLTTAYNTFNNAGRYRAPVSILKVVNGRGEVLESWTPGPGRQVLGAQGEQISYLISNMLSDNNARHYMFGPNNVMEMPDGRPVAVKTGTSNDYRDSWAVGYTPEITIGVWVGNSDNTAMDEIAGANGAGTIWRNLMLSFNTDRPVVEFARPNGVVEAAICTDTGALASDACPRTTNEVFVAGSEPRAPNVSYQTVRVAGDGSCLAASYTPASEIREESFALYPPEFRDWAVRAGVPQPPTEFCPPPSANIDTTLAQLNQPSATGVITSAQVFLSGTARGSYVLDAGMGREPSNWQVISEGSTPILNGLIGVWVVSGLPPGEYTVRLRVSTFEGPIASDSQVIILSP